MKPASDLVSLGEMVYRTVNYVSTPNDVADIHFQRDPMIWDVIALGETMVVLAPPVGQSFRNAGTVLVDHAGAESNTCVGLARLGFRVAWISRLGTDSA